MRRVFVKGELGGSSAGRYGSAGAFVMLWLIYVIFAGLGTYEFEAFNLDTFFKSVRDNVTNKQP
jgi:hypothetical protein